MQKRIVNLLFLIATLGYQTAAFTQVDSTDHSYLRIKLENDYFSLGEWTDRYFSNGLRFEYQTPQGWSGLNGLRKLFPLLPGKTHKKVKLNLIFQMSMFTPEDLSQSEIIEGDRPYAGLAYFALGGISNDFAAGTRITTEYGIGMIGPATQQGKIQTAYHKALVKNGAKRVVVPQGWHNQIANDLVLNVRTEYERIVFAPVQNIESIGGFEVNFGTLTNYVALNANLRVGKFNDYFYNSSGLKMRDKKPAFDKMLPGRPFFPANVNRKWQYYFYVKPSLRFTLHNSLLQGGVINREGSPYVIPGDQLKRSYLNVEFGYGLVYKRLGFLFLQQFRSREFDGANPTTWGTVYVLIGMGGR